MKILIAKDDSGRELYENSDKKAVIVDGEEEILMDVGVESVLQRGYWETVEKSVEKPALPQNINKKSAFTYR
jgi:hypothetical protein